MHKTLILLCILGGVDLLSRPFDLDPNRAEEILAKIQFPERLTDSDWKTLLGALIQDKYKVQPGDNLWKISKKSIKNPRLWRKIWEINPELLNPHQLEVGQMINYYREGRSLASTGAPIEVPLVKLVPNRPGEVSDLDDSRFVNVDIKNRYQPLLRVLSQEDEILGNVAGSYSPWEHFVHQDSIFLRFDEDEKVKKGDRFAIVRVDRNLANGLGRLVQTVGEVEVQEFSEGLVRAEIKAVYGPLGRKDLIVKVTKPVEWLEVFNPPSDLKAEIISGDDEERRVFGQGQIVLLDKGSNDGIKQGQLFRAIQNKDPVTGDSRSVIPDFKAELQIIQTSEKSSVAYILRNSEPLIIGDVLFAHQTFPDKVPPPRRQLEIITMD